MAPEIVLEDRIVYCPTCDGDGEHERMWMGSDNTDVDWLWDVCDNCDGSGYWSIQRVEVMA